MFQSFDVNSDPSHGLARVKALRAELSNLKLAAFLVPRADQHQGEYVAPCSERLAWLTGFTGSAGLTVVTTKRACLFVDGRYSVQAPAEIDTDIFEIGKLKRQDIVAWLKDALKKGRTIGFDPWLHTAAEIERLTKGLSPHGIKLKAIARNPVDRVWGDARPKPPVGAVRVQPLKFAGRSAKDKIADLQKALKADGYGAVILTLPDSICWLLNIRGSDIAHNPVVLSFAIVPASGKVELFVDAEKLDTGVRAHITDVARVRAPLKLNERVKALKSSGKRVRIDKNTAAYWFFKALPKSQIANAADPCLAPKARKTKAEVSGARAAQARDGAAVCQFLSWLDRQEAGSISEIDAVKALEEFRANTGKLLELSFDTIAGSGPNGAIVHYRVNSKTNRKLKPGELFLIDSGAQYQDGTTDITRTVAIGKPSREMCERFTLVLKGHIGIATARFPEETRGVDLDPFARAALWAHGLDYSHGTGHGIGSYLSVHEGPQSISRAGMVALKPGMIISNEPGYYKQGAYGIRIENLVLVREPMHLPDGDREMMSFETMTLVPIDRRLIVMSLMSAVEIDWLNAYHMRVRDEIGPLLDKADRNWLAQATAPID